MVEACVFDHPFASGPWSACCGFYMACLLWSALVILTALQTPVSHRTNTIFPRLQPLATIKYIVVMSNSR